VLCQQRSQDVLRGCDASDGRSELAHALGALWLLCFGVLPHSSQFTRSRLDNARTRRFDLIMATLQEAFDRLVSEIAELKKTVNGLWENSLEDLKNDVKSEAEFRTLKSLVQELSAHAGISQEEFDQHYKKRFRFFHAQILERDADTAPNLSAQIDDRPIDACAPDEQIEPLFPPENDE
jgi:hypothetical protein